MHRLHTFVASAVITTAAVFSAACASAAGGQHSSVPHSSEVLANGVGSLRYIDVFWQYGAVPEGVWLPDQGISSYRGR